MKEKKEEVLRAYKEAKKDYLTEKNEENWKAFCEAKRKCMLLGVII